MVSCQIPPHGRAPVSCSAIRGALFASSACGPCLLALILLRVPAWLLPCAFHWTSYMCPPFGLCAPLAAMANARDVISIYLSSCSANQLCPGLSLPGNWGRDGGDTAAVLPGLKLGIILYSWHAFPLLSTYVDNVHNWELHLINLPGDVLAAPESASGLDRCNISLSLSLSQAGWNICNLLYLCQCD